MNIRYMWWLPCLGILALGCSSPETANSDLAEISVDTDISAEGLWDSMLDAFVVDTRDTLEIGEPDVQPGEFGAPCTGNEECYSGWCVEGLEGYLCTKMCTEECPDDFDCKSVFSGASDVVFLCLPRIKKLCLPCADDIQCTGGACLTLDGTGQCAYECNSDEDCPKTGYTCAGDALGEKSGTFCQPITGSCSCSEGLNGSQRTCFFENDVGTCVGVQTCGADTGWGPCSAVEAQEETCDGLDNNCNALIDEGIEDGGPCSNDLEGVGSCAGTLVCLGSQGYLCQAPIPEVEACDFKDNDCDDLVDEDFKDDAGVFSLTANCGTCGNDCTEKIPHGLGKCADNNGTPVCVVDTCDEDYVAINAFQCALPPDVSCQPCAVDDDCYGGTCIELDNQNVCASPCGGGAASCQDGYECTEIAPAVERCIPVTESCVCSALTDGQIRTCKNDNDFGICYGQETCDGAAGWMGCNAVWPDDETCDGVDNNCNGLIDDGIEEGGACANAVEGIGSCEGVLICLGPIGYVCQAETPVIEACDFKDNDCDGEIDEDFTDDTGVFSTTPHCGTCGNDCSQNIPNGVGKCTDNNGTPVCVVDTCDQDYVAINAFQCALPPDVSCQPCVGDDDCYGGSCIVLDGQNVCVSPCGVQAGSCQDDYVCQELEPGVERCIPLTQSCVCSPLTDGQTRTCKQNNAFGICYGEETCDGQQGWSGCTAKEPIAEICNGLDDDCNGAADDGVTPPEEACVKDNAFGSCTGSWFCAPTDNGVAWWCSANAPEADICDYQDNDCDGVADQDFKWPGTEAYVDDQNCGACGIICDGAIPNATAACAYNEGKPYCQVVECDLGYYQAGPLTCLPAADTLCSPCETDANCLIPGDQCLEMDGAAYCGRDCSADNLYGVPEGTCPPGYQCAALGDGAQQCMPISNACSCLVDDEGENRSCIESNAFGSCFGKETCDPDVGWVGCTATVPGSEVCDDKDNDCNAVVDDVPGRGDDCSITNAIGTCAGLLDCADGDESLVCVGKTPSAEACNYGDDDCNGKTDEGFDDLYDSCTVGTGICQRYGFKECTGDGLGTKCNMEPGAPVEEICDSLDNNCDGQTDEGYPALGQVCTDGIGGCKVTGVASCTADGQGVTCSAIASDPVQEVCNGVDDDCDGNTDNNLLQLAPCTNQQGVCAGSTRSCGGGGGWATCVGPEYGPLWEQTELTCDGLDNDCDGKVDSGLPAKPCENQWGVCAGSFAICAGQAGYANCNGAVYGDNYEQAETTCDSLDNDCDGDTDEGFVNPDTLKYESDTACGSCFVNCTTIYDKPNAFGQCDASGAPTCAMICEPGYFDMNKVPDDGCEFYLDPTTIYVSIDDASALDVNGCGQGPVGTGPGHFPCGSIAQGLIEAAAGYANVRVADGLYEETVTLVNGISLLGGYRADTWERHLDTTLTTLRGTSDLDGHAVTVVAEGITEATLLEGFEIEGQNNEAAQGNTYAIYVDASDNSLTVRHNTLHAGNAGKGLDGVTGESGGTGANGQGQNQEGGTPSLYDAFTATGGGKCSNSNNRQYTNGGTKTCGGQNVSGGNGGGNKCSPSIFGQEISGVDGSAGQGSGGAGGDAGNDGYIENGSCYLPDQSMTGAPGGNAASGVDGNGGGGCSSVFGVVLAGHWVGAGGGAGVTANDGGGGGGGGAGGGGACGICGENKDRLGGHGGGGGSGGCGGLGGAAGSGGGGSFGVFVASGAVPTVHDNTIYRGTAGAAGSGGSGGTGGAGGNGGDGGSCPGSCHCHKSAGKGGEGGEGGHGGGGGGGCGGLSYGIYAAVTGASLCNGVNTITDGGSGGGGSGGLSLGDQGADGDDGLLGDCYTK